MRVRTTRSLARRDERGAVLVLAALVLTTLLVFAALVIDIANATQVRRQSQNTADAASLAGSADLPNGPAAAAAAKAYAAKNLDIAPADWVGCRDAERLPVLPDPANDNQCISIDSLYSQVRVKLPTQRVDTFFARILGSDHLDVGADAIAEAQLRKNTRIIPATITVAAGTGLMCIENSGNNATCASRVRGQFGNLDSPRLYIYKPDKNQDPSNLRTNYAMSLDHEVVIWKTGAVNVCDGESEPTPCVLNNTDTLYDANYLMPYTGNVIPPVTEGWVQGFTISTGTTWGTWHFCGRLQRPDITAGNITETTPDDCTNPDHRASRRRAPSSTDATSRTGCSRGPEPSSIPSSAPTTRRWVTRASWPVMPASTASSPATGTTRRRGPRRCRPAPASCYRPGRTSGPCSKKSWRTTPASASSRSWRSSATATRTRTSWSTSWASSRTTST